MKERIITLLLIAVLPALAMAQSNDDLYFVPKKNKKTERKEEVRKVQKADTMAVYATSGSKIVVKDVTGKVRDVDEYNRRYTSRDNTFTVENDTLYIEEKPYNERGEWVNGFEGSQDDYEYAMRIVRFRSPRYAIPVSSPLYWEVVSGVYPSWDWNVYDDGLYAYVFPTYTNPMWWDWRWNWGVSGPHWGFGFYGSNWSFSWGWSSPWYGGWYPPYWYGGYWAGYWGPGYWGPGWHHHPHYPHAGWAGPSYNYNNRRESIRDYHRPSSAPSYRRSLDNRGRTGGRVVSGSRNGNSSVLGNGVRVGRDNSVYARPSTGGNRGGSGYTRPATTRPTTTRPNSGNSYRNTNAYERMRNSGANRGYNSNTNRGSYSSGSSSRGGGSYHSSGGGGGNVRSGSHRR